MRHRPGDVNLSESDIEASPQIKMELDTKPEVVEAAFARPTDVTVVSTEHHHINDRNQALLTWLQKSDKEQEDVKPVVTRGRAAAWSAPEVSGEKTQITICLLSLASQRWMPWLTPY